MTKHKVYWIASSLLIILIIAMIGVHWNDLPDQLPIHFNASGEVDNYGERSDIFFLPILASILVGLLYWVTKQLKINPYRKGIKTSRQLEITKNLIRQFALIITLLFGWISYVSMSISVGKMKGLGKWFLLIVFVSTSTPLVIFWVKQWRLKERQP